MAHTCPPSVKFLAKISFESFNLLPKTGKPAKNEWTVLSTIIQHDELRNVTKVVAIGTGTKCIGRSQLCPNGLILNDSHAEVIARRSLLRYLYENIQNAISDNENIFVYNKLTKKFKLRDCISFHFFSTHAPCGDASIIQESDEHDDSSPKCKKSKLDKNTVFTGAKLIDSITSDSMDQQIGALRTKPGRGERTLSMSCSDKLSRWNLMGIQGALLDTVLENPIYLKSFNFCGDVNKYSIRRAIFERWKANNFENLRFQPYKPHIQIDKSKHSLFSQSDGKVPTPTSISWCNIPAKPLEVAVSGKKQGVIKKNLKSKLGSLEICKLNLFEKYLDILSSNRQISQLINLDYLQNNIELSYYVCKQNSVEYYTAWQLAKKVYFQNWTVKPVELLWFHIDKSII